MTGRDDSIRITGKRRRRLDTRRLAEALVRITINAHRPADGLQQRGVIDRSNDDEERER